MRNAALVLAVVAAVALALDACPAFAVGLDVDVASGNDFYFAATPTGPGGIYQLTGYEYGLGYNDRLGSGTARVAGGVLYLGVSSTSGSGSGAGDYGSMGMMSHIVDLGSMTGTYDYLYMYVNLGAPAGHGGMSTVNVYVVPGPPPKGAAGEGADEALP